MGKTDPYFELRNQNFGTEKVDNNFFRLKIMNTFPSHWKFESLKMDK